VAASHFETANAPAVAGESAVMHGCVLLRGVTSNSTLFYVPPAGAGLVTVMSSPYVSAIGCQ